MLKINFLHVLLFQCCFIFTKENKRRKKSAKKDTKESGKQKEKGKVAVLERSRVQMMKCKGKDSCQEGRGLVGVKRHFYAYLKIHIVGKS